MGVEDFEAIHELHSHPMVAQYNTLGIPANLSVTAATMQLVLSDANALLWTIRKREDNAFIGEIGLKISAEKYRKAEFHYSLHPDHWGVGFATEAVQLIINYGFSHLKLHRLEAGVATENVKSIAVLERVGMQREGLCRKILPLASGWANNYMYAMLEEDPRNY